jgi:hypothetical protein
LIAGGVEDFFHADIGVDPLKYAPWAALLNRRV